MVKSTKRKKHQDRDKYYHLAKEQGLRSRAAFKLSQMNRKYNFITNSTKVVLDLCAAPGGWSQIIQRTISSRETLIVAVDIHPIRAIGHNVRTLIGDITTDSCQSSIRKELSGASVDVVLCDGAPDIGNAYDKDAFQQNELVLSALKCATKHLRPRGYFVTKVYRSRDYTALMWAVQQFFGDVQAVKPSSSRMASSEIFWVCKDYKAPTSIDPKLLDPKSVFAELSDDEDNADKKKKKMTLNSIVTKKQKRFRDGYDYSDVDFVTMRKIGNVYDFISSNDPVRILAEYSGLSFVVEKAHSMEDEERLDIESKCKKCLDHEDTTFEIKECLQDLKVLNKGDFKTLLNWRNVMKAMLKEEDEEDSDEDEQDSDDDQDAHSEQDSDDSEKEEKKIQEDIEALRLKKLRRKKREKKKKREVMAKQRKRAEYGMNYNALDTPGAMTEQGIFTIKSLKNQQDLETVHEVDLDKVTYDDIHVSSESEHEAQGYQESDEDTEDDVDSETGYNYRMEKELDNLYEDYLTKTKSKQEYARVMKRKKLATKTKLAQQEQEDDELIHNGTATSQTKGKRSQVNLNAADMDHYVTLLNSDSEHEGGNISSSTDEESSDEEDHDSNNDEVIENPKIIKTTEKNPLIHELPDALSTKTTRWFSNPLFENIGSAAAATSTKNKDKGKSLSNNQVEISSSEEDEDMDDDNTSTERKENKKSKSRKGLSPQEILASMPKTDKEIRHEKRLKAWARREKRQAKKERKLARAFGQDYNTQEMEIVSSTKSKQIDDPKAREERKKENKRRSLIKAGLGDELLNDKEKSKIDIVSAQKQTTHLPIIDTRKYDSENEDYDSDDVARTLAIGTMILRPSKEKAFVDASYNRYAWNDPEDLPDWFLDDEYENYKPQLPIPPQLLEKMKEKMKAMSEKPMAKVVQARARKNKRAKLKLAAAKKKAESIANAENMSESMKLKAISKAMKGKDTPHPSKTYVVAKKSAGKNGQAKKGVKLVDKRMKSDKRGTENAVRKRKKGKQGGLVGRKKRRHHS